MSHKINDSFRLIKEDILEHPKTNNDLKKVLAKNNRLCFKIDSYAVDYEGNICYRLNSDIFTWPWFVTEKDIKKFFAPIRDTRLVRIIEGMK